jgi:cytochrome c553
MLSLGVAAGGVSAAEQKAAAKPDAAKGSTIATQVCAGCHGADGNSVAPANPKLAAQHPEYLVKQLNNFKVQPGAQKAERENAIMAGFAGTLSPEDMANLGAYFAQQKPKGGAAKLKDSLELGQKIYRGGIAEKNVPACAGCHSPNGAGIPAQYPRLSGQHADYTEAQLVAFRGGVRKNSAQMMTISARLSDAEIKAVSDYIAGLN